MATPTRARRVTRAKDSEGKVLNREVASGEIGAFDPRARRGVMGFVGGRGHEGLPLSCILQTFQGFTFRDLAAAALATLANCWCPTSARLSQMWEDSQFTHICQNQADMGHPALFSACANSRSFASLRMTLRRVFQQPARVVRARRGRAAGPRRSRSRRRWPTAGASRAVADCRA